MTTVEVFEHRARRGGRIVAISHAAAILARSVRPDGLILDVGCGTGLLAAELPRYPVVAVDLAASLLAGAAQRAVGVAKANALALPIRDRTVAAAVSLFVVDDYNADDKKQVVDELLRVSSPGGCVVLGAYAPTDERMGSRRSEFSDRTESHPVFLEDAAFYRGLLRGRGAHDANSYEIESTGAFTSRGEDRVVHRRFLVVTANAP